MPERSLPWVFVLTSESSPHAREAGATLFRGDAVDRRTTSPVLGIGLRQSVRDALAAQACRKTSGLSTRAARCLSRRAGGVDTAARARDHLVARRKVLRSHGR